MRGLNKIMELVLEFNRIFELDDFGFHLAQTADYIEDKRLAPYEARELFFKAIEATINTAGPIGALSRRILEVLEESFKGTVVHVEGDAIDFILVGKLNNPANKNFKHSIDY